eukprot:6176443-Pleurochrysis_carterae.AAC.1
MSDTPVPECASVGAALAKKVVVSAARRRCTTSPSPLRTNIGHPRASATHGTALARMPLSHVWQMVPAAATASTERAV